MPKAYSTRRVQEFARFQYQFSLRRTVDCAGDMTNLDFATRRVKHHGTGMHGNKPGFCAGLYCVSCSVANVRDVICTDTPRV